MEDFDGSSFTLDSEEDQILSSNKEKGKERVEAALFVENTCHSADCFLPVMMDKVTGSAMAGRPFDGLIGLKRIFTFQEEEEEKKRKKKEEDLPVITTYLRKPQIKHIGMRIMPIGSTTPAAEVRAIRRQQRKGLKSSVHHDSAMISSSSGDGFKAEMSPVKKAKKEKAREEGKEVEGEEEETKEKTNKTKKQKHNKKEE